VAKRTSVEEAIRTLTFSQYKDWRNDNHIPNETGALYEVIGAGRRSYLE